MPYHKNLKGVQQRMANSIVHVSVNLDERSALPVFKEIKEVSEKRKAIVAQTNREMVPTTKDVGT